jgi:hypothetical protein
MKTGIVTNNGHLHRIVASDKDRSNSSQPKRARKRKPDSPEQDRVTQPKRKKALIDEYI